MGTAGAADVCAASNPRCRTAEAQRAGAVRSSFRRLQPEVGKSFVIRVSFFILPLRTANGCAIRSRICLPR